MQIKTRHFSGRCYPLIQDAVAKGEASGRDLAYFTDRVRTPQGKPQVYATQFREVDGVLQAKPIKNVQEVDARRAAVGLESMAQYVARGGGR